MHIVYYIQKAFNEAFADAPVGSECTTDTLQSAIEAITSASSVQSTMKKLLEKDMITETGKVFSVTDKLFAMWINGIYGNPARL